MEKILITGGAGFVGTALVKILLQLPDFHLAIVDNFFTGRRESVPDHPHVICYEADIRDRVRLGSFFSSWQPDVVIHLAAIHYIPYCNNNPTETMLVNILGTRNVFDACRLVLPRLVFFASSAAVYPVYDGPLSEESTPSPTDIYGVSKVGGEALAENYFFKTGCPTVIGRLFNVYGPGDTNPHLIPSIVEQLKAGRRTIELGNLDTYRDFIHVTDVADAILRLVLHFRYGFDVFNIGTGYEYSAADVIRMCQDILGEPIQVIRAPDRVRKSDRPHLCADVTKIKRTLNWLARKDFAQGLRELIWTTI